MDSFDEIAFQDDAFDAVLILRPKPKNMVMNSRQPPVIVPKKQTPS